MNEKRLLLAVRRGQLTARIAAQRTALAEHSQAVKSICATGDQIGHALHWLRQRPLAVGAGVALLAAARPRRSWRWAKRGFFMWRGWQALRSGFNALR
ncbi:YqjK family protein [Azonexus sp.]|uniref:YqjK family protein n=1 Tax=Azonexus sp. TaxID=1872668 RepID=UPI0039E34217